MNIVALEPTYLHPDANAEDSDSDSDPSGGTASATMLRIRNILDRAKHPETPQPEAERCVALAARELHRHQLDEQMVIAYTDELRTIDDVFAVGAAYDVNVQNSRTKNTVSRAKWLETLAVTCADGFNVIATLCFSANTSSKFTFYGPRLAAKSCADAFALYTNAIVKAVVTWRCPCMPDAADTDVNASAESLRTQLSAFIKDARLSYRDGLVAGLRNVFAQNERDERERVDALQRLVDEHDEQERLAELAQRIDVAAIMSGIDATAAAVAERYTAALTEVHASRALSLHVANVCDSVKSIICGPSAGRRLRSLKPRAKRIHQAYIEGFHDAKKIRGAPPPRPPAGAPPPHPPATS